jgi:flavin reductase (DIM6/NTAB) family NADH-FMN oxidoreductase RutF
VAYLEAKVVSQADAGTHTVFVGEIVQPEVLREDEPMTYAYYHQVKRGITPKAARLMFKKKRRLPGWQNTSASFAAISMIQK